MAKSKNYNNWIKENYPKKCSNCNYIANNPSMYHYHAKTHESIPLGKLCDHGCNQLALFRNTKGSYTCKKNAHQCPSYLERHSQKVKEDWKGNESRKKNAKETFYKYCYGVPEVAAKKRKTLKEKWGNFTPDQAREYRHYARRIRTRAQKWAKEQGYVLGQQTYHVDHKLSIWDAWHAGLSEEIVNHPCNLQILEAKANSSKRNKSILSIDELTNLIKAARN